MRRTDFYENLRGNPKVVEEEKYQKKKKVEGGEGDFFHFYILTDSCHCN